MGNFQKYWLQNVGQDFIVLDFFVGGISCGRKRCVWEINACRAWDPVHAGDKALTRETPAERGWVNRYAVDRGFVSWLGHFRLSRVMSAVDRGFMSWLGHFRLSRVMSAVDRGFMSWLGHFRLSRVMSGRLWVQAYKIGICCLFTKGERAKTGWLGTRIMCPSGATCLSADFCFNRLTL